MHVHEIEEIEPEGTYRPQYHLRWRGLATLLDRIPWLKTRVANALRRGLRHVFEPGMVTTERVVEYPFVFQHLGPPDGPVLDVGCSGSRLPIALASRGYRVVGFDFSGYPYPHPGLRAVRGDIIRAPFDDASFSRIIAISVIEHIGIGHYGDPLAGEGDHRAVEEIARLLRPGGRTILTVPFGKAMINDWMRVYDPPRLRRLIGPLQPQVVEYAVGDDGQWGPAEEDRAARIDWNGPSRSVALVVAAKPPARQEGR